VRRSFDVIILLGKMLKEFQNSDRLPQFQKPL
jgi:hypothetical protein